MTHHLTIEPLGDAIEVADGQTILDACLRSGIYLPHACGHGLCGTCKTAVLDCDIDHGAASPFALMDFERDEGFILARTATLKSDVTIEADVEQDPDARRIAVSDFDGVVVGLDSLTHDVKGVRLALEAEGIDFQAGQYVMVSLPGVEGARLLDRQCAVRRQTRRAAGAAGPRRRRHGPGAVQRSLWPLRRVQVARRAAPVPRRRHRRVEPAGDDP